MKKTIKYLLTIIPLALTLSFANTSTNAQVVSIPDANFKAALIAAGVDKNKDGEIEENEAMMVEKLEISVKDISSLEGITAFKHLAYLSCGSNDIRSIDLSKNTELTDLNFSNNKLTSLDISALVNLKRLICSMNKLTVLDVSHNKLTLLDCSYNQLSDLDISANKDLSALTCSHNPSLTKIYIAADIIPGNGWEKDASAKWVNRPPVVVSGSPGNTGSGAKEPIVSIPDANFKAALIAAGVDKNNDGIIQESEAIEVVMIDVSNKSVTSLEGISAFKNLHNLDCSGNNLTTLDITNNERLTTLYCSDNQLTILDVSKNVNLESLFVTGNNLTSIDVSKNTALTYLICGRNQITSLDIHNNTKLTHFKCDRNKIGSLDVSSLVFLESLGCEKTQISSLDLSKNQKLTSLECWDSNLRELDVSGNTELSSIDCTGNPSLTRIYISTGMTPAENWKKDDTAQWIKK